MDKESLARQRPRAHDGGAAAELAVLAATEELLQESSLHDLTVAHIIKRAGLSRANFYHYFASKFDVVVAMVSRLLTDTYTDEGPWNSELGRNRQRALGDNLQRTIGMWSAHGPLICAVVENMHSTPALAAAWNVMLQRFVSAIAEQVDHERAANRAPAGASADLIATVLVCGYERSFYIGQRGLDNRIPDPESTVASITELTLAGIYGGKRRTKRARKRKSATATAHPVTMPETHRQKPAAGGDAETKAAILQATNELLGEMSLDQLSVAKILERSKLSRATFYFYFESKDDAFIDLFQAVADDIVRGFIDLAATDRTHTDSIRGAIRTWLDLDPADLGVLRNAIHEWPRRPELRQRYLTTVATMTATMEQIIGDDRAAGLAVDGPPAPEFAAVLLWTIERSIAGSLAGETNLQDIDAVASFLGDLLVSSLYGI
ncbi:TetR/AcrR family transcriptional regulator [Nocardia carnea]|uniref:TetR/AcrR family transcriptional regulator n=1 Tax=Nocardia carnea TaxID=37328 RepID=A0ABW7TX03_9NOCA|nr:TetR/AcrR family transcriptional regulator [Nocardia carnea]